MALDWRTVKPQHVSQACDLLVKGNSRPRAPAKGIFLVYGGDRLPAKHAVRIAYCLANKLPLDSKLKFSSGQGTVNLLRALGFNVEREPKQASA